MLGQVMCWGGSAKLCLLTLLLISCSPRTYSVDENLSYLECNSSGLVNPRTISLSDVNVQKPVSLSWLLEDMLQAQKDAVSEFFDREDRREAPDYLEQLMALLEDNFHVARCFSAEHRDGDSIYEFVREDHSFRIEGYVIVRENILAAVMYSTVISN